MPVGSTDGATSPAADPALSDTIAAILAEQTGAEGAVEPADDATPQDDAPAEQAAPASDPGDAGTPGTTAPTTSEPAATTAATGSPAAPASDTTPPPSEPDPLDGAEPFTYAVDGQTRQMEGVYRIPGEGLIVPEERVPQFQLLASRAESLERQNRDLYQRTQDLDRLTQWKTAGPDGTEQTLSGREALEAQRVSLARATAALDTVARVFAQAPTSFLTTDPQGNIVWSREAVQHLLTASQLAEETAEKSVRQSFQALATQAAAPSAPPAPNLADVAPALVQQVITQQQATGLTPEDRAFLAEQLAHYVRPATAEDVRQNPALALGESVLDPRFHALVTRTATLRTESAQAARTTQQAARFNAGQQQGRAGQTPAAPPPPTPRTASQPPAAPQGRQAQWDAVLQTALAELST